MKYNTEFWEQVLKEYEAGTLVGICHMSDRFSVAWERIIVADKIALLAKGWPSLPSGTDVSKVEYLFWNDDMSLIEERQTRIDFLNYLIYNKIEFEI